MLSRYVERDAEALVDRFARDGVGRDIALRLYTARLLGQEPLLVLHGGGNVSVKTRLPDLLGEEVAVLCVKGSGRNMATLDATGLPALRLEPLQRLCARASLADGDLLRLLRANLIDPTAPDPSVEVLLHAVAPHRFVDHTHANAVLSLIDQPDGAARCADVYGSHVAFVPYARPGFPLARKAAEALAIAPAAEGLVLDKHGLFAFGATAREAYERMIALVSAAEAYLQQRRRTVFTVASLPAELAAPAEIAPVIRGACSLADPQVEGAYLRLITDFRSTPAILAFVGGAEAARYACAGVVTPDHSIRTKAWPLLLPPLQAADLDRFKQRTRAAVSAFVARYVDYFSRHNARAGGGKTMLDPLPRVALVPGVGLFGLGRSKKEAQIAADLAEAAVAVIADAEAIGRFESISEAETFDCEYWSLEQKKLDAARDLPLAGQVAAITGAGGAIGRATAAAFAAAGAELALLDVDRTAAESAAEKLGGAALALRCDVTDTASVRDAFARLVETFGGVDIVVSNAGAAWQGRIGEVDEAVLRQSFELNFFGHQRVAQAAVKIMLAQGMGGCLLFNVSKQAVNPGPNFGPYGLPKAATLFLVRQYALDYGAEGIRANAVNADRVRSGLLTGEMIAARSQARGLSEKEYMSGNLLGREVTAQDVAQAFLAQALALKTTAGVTTVDGGNIAAALR